MNKQKCPVGTIVKLSSPQPVYGIVIDREIWLENATKENLNEVYYFLEGEKERGKGSMTPIFFWEILSAIDLSKSARKFLWNPISKNVGIPISKTLVS